jgi:translation initiation factor IF-3
MQAQDQRQEEKTTIRRPMRAAPAVQKDGPRTNEDIRIREVQLIDHTGANRGTVPTQEALALARDNGLDLVEISPNNNPPVAKIMDYGKYRFQEQKKAAEARKKQKTVEVKEIKLRPGIDKHDYEVKLRAMQRFFEEGDKVKVTLRFRGREMAHQELGYNLLKRIREDNTKFAKVESEPLSEGRQIVMILAPK